MLPKEWYIAQILWLEDQLSLMPRCLAVNNRGSIAVRIFNDAIKNYIQISKKHEEYNFYLNVATLRKQYTNQLHEAKKQLATIYKTNYLSIKGKYTLRNNKNIKFNQAYWEKAVTNCSKFRPDSEIVSNGVEFKSRLEKDFASELRNLGLTFVYEPRMYINPNKARYSDFGLFFPMFNRCVFIELMGAMNNQEYVDDQCTKLKEYLQSGFYIGRDLFILSGNEKYLPGQMQMRDLIINIITSLCEMYLVKINKPHHFHEVMGVSIN